ncbi:VOC family protein [Ornithinibacillus californiensis]|uniref:VOC family protein n=1 Tax=Ornithinibacillus californiensis TaxID=161536 RepID=UPI00064DF1E7|nr:VOC family protein [Ornithinibacillus californiensis]
MSNFIKRVGTTYLPVESPAESSRWYQEILGAKENYRDEEKAILDFANQSFFLVRAMPGEKIGFRDSREKDHFLFTFEVDGLEQLIEFQSFLKSQEVRVGEIEDRGHPGNNFIFYDLDGNMFDVWSELSPSYKDK